jgi:ABC-2 type transport system ATP-binding protein
VDPASRRDFWDLIYRLAGEGSTILVTTHYTDEAEHCDRIALLHDSRLIAVGTPAELKETVPGMVLEVRAGPLDVALHALAPWQPALYGTALHVAVADASARERVEEALRAAGIDEVDIRPIAPSLEDAFLALMAGGKVGRAA